MRLRSRTTVAAAGAAFALAAGGGGALAAGGLGGSAGGPGGQGGLIGPGGPPGPTAVASYLGLTADNLLAQLQSGKTLAQIAAAQGKSVSGLEEVMYADAKTHLDQAVADGKLTAAQEQTMLADLKSHLDEIVNHTGPLRGGPGLVVGGPPFGAAAASYLGLTADELRTQVMSGKSLAQIAAARDKSVAGLEAAILTEAKSHLDQAVADGKLGADQAKAMLAELTSHLDDLVNRAGPPSRP